MVVRVYADVREEKSGIPGILSGMGIVVVRKHLPLGDYIVGDEVVIERKAPSDFASSLFDGRLFDQAQRMYESYESVVFIVEGNPAALRRYRDKAQSIYSALVALQMDYNAKVIYTSGPHDTAQVIAALARRSARGGGQRIVIHRKPRLSTIREWQLYIVQSFPGVGPKTAERILETFSSLEAFFNSSIAELSRIPGLGPSKAERIKAIIKAPYKARRESQRSLERFLHGGGEGE